MTDNPKDIAGEKKPPLHLIPLNAQIVQSLALRNGAEKYGPFNWREIDIRASAYVGAALRHINLWWDTGEEDAKDSGVHHLGHALATLAILYDALTNDTLVDDRPAGSEASGLMDTHTKDMKQTPKLDFDTLKTSDDPDETDLSEKIKAMMGEDVDIRSIRIPKELSDLAESLAWQTGSTDPAIVPKDDPRVMHLHVPPFEEVRAFQQDETVVLDTPLNCLPGEILQINPGAGTAKVIGLDGGIVEETSVTTAEGFSDSVLEYIAPDAIQVDITDD